MLEPSMDIGTTISINNNNYTKCIFVYIVCTHECIMCSLAIGLNVNTVIIIRANYHGDIAIRKTK